LEYLHVGLLDVEVVNIHVIFEDARLGIAHIQFLLVLWGWYEV
jgi:hypothetical protein